jgi:hypothetical protein
MTHGNENVLRLRNDPVERCDRLPIHFRVGKQAFWATPKDFHVVWFLSTFVISRWRQSSQTPSRSLLSYRQEFRAIADSKPVTGLVWCLLRSRREESRLLAVWLLGRVGADRVATLLRDEARDASLRVRRATVKALRRLGRLREMRTLTAIETDERMLRLAGYAPRNFPRVLAKWHVPEGAAVAPPPRPLEVFVEIGADSPRRPKSRDFIRRILDHIRHLLRDAR